MANIDFNLLRQKFFYDGNNFKQNTGKAGVKPIVTVDTVLLETCKLTNLPYSEVEELLDVIKEKLTVKKQGSISLSTQELIDKVKESGLFKEFYILKPSNESPWILFRKKDRILTRIDSLRSLKPEDFFGYIKGSVDDDLGRNIQKLIAPLIKNDKNPNPSMEECVRYLLKEVLITELIDEENKIPYTTPVYPAAIEGSGLVAFYDIPFTKQNVKFSDLNEHLQDLLSRIENHKHLCAIIWGSLTGVSLPYLVYLIGTGGDGKSSFINMLIKIVNGSVAIYSGKGDFAGGEMYGKAIIQVSENTNPYLLNDGLIKSITGGNTIRVNSKGKDAFFAQFKSLVIADSNENLEVIGDPSEIRRLRYHKINPPNITEEDIISPDIYTDLLNSTQNEFLNYCNQCFDELKTKYGQISLPANNKDIIEGLRNSSVSPLFEKFIAGFGYNEGADLSCKKDFVFSELIAKLGKTIPFVEKKFRNYVQFSKGWKIENNKIIGWGEETSSKESGGFDN